MSSTSKEEQSTVKKSWSKPEVFDQSVVSLTKSKPVTFPTEASPTTGPS